MRLGLPHRGAPEWSGVPHMRGDTAMNESSFGSRTDLYAAVTAKVVAAIEAGAGLFVMPWHRAANGIGRPINAVTGKRYRGSNAVALWAEARLSGYPSDIWATYRQWQTADVQVRRGERGSMIIFYQSIEGGEEEDDPRRRRYVARASKVFNVGQVDGWQAPEMPRPALAEVASNVEAFIEATGAMVRHGFEHACYNRRADAIELPDRDRFIGSPTSSATEAYCSTVLHELTHWSGAAPRLNRIFGTRFGDNAYAVEELVAELGAAFLCADLTVTNEPRPDHAAYLSSWLAVLRADASALMSAARLADQAAAYLHVVAMPSRPFG